MQHDSTNAVRVKPEFSQPPESARIPRTSAAINTAQSHAGAKHFPMGTSIPGIDVENALNNGAQSSLKSATADVAAQMALPAFEIMADGIWITRMDGARVYRNPAGALLESVQWRRGGCVAKMADVVFSQGIIDHARAGENELGIFHLCYPGAAGCTERSVCMEVRIVRDAAGAESGLLYQARDVSPEWDREQTLQDQHVELEAAYARLKETQIQLLQSEKMASIGQLAAGVAHEINNPIGYVHSNLGTLQSYARGLLSLLAAYDHLVQTLPDSLRSAVQTIEELKTKVDYSFLQLDLQQLVEESREGIDRVKKIVMDLRDFSHAGDLETGEFVLADIHRGLQSTINIVWNELKYKAEIRQDFGTLPLIECIPSQLNQVFLNLLVNAGQAIIGKGVITITTRCVGDEVSISVADTGQGILPEHLERLFDPFFTTKVVGKGTGLGLWLSYGIVQKHGGRMEVESTIGEGTVFRVTLPVQRAPR